MVLKGGYDIGKAQEPDYRKVSTNCGIEKDKREFDINQIQAGNRIVRRDAKSAVNGENASPREKKKNL
ncbi:MAG: hypothetical protein GDA54_01215 [Alphaproteobacteria bacterium GM7ARS4]|nr:hypothetical protein [Alphaproteobacteria bacterium GM7ARS4]